VKAVPAIVVAAAAASSIDTKHAADAANSRSHARTDCAADDRSDRTRRASAFAYAFPAALLRAAENALGVPSVRDSQQRKHRGRYREISLHRHAGWQRQCRGFHLDSLMLGQTGRKSAGF
jgi:hypothetical protein